MDISSLKYRNTVSGTLVPFKLGYGVLYFLCTRVKRVRVTVRYGEPNNTLCSF
jgi:hypothetical protein